MTSSNTLLSTLLSISVYSERETSFRILIKHWQSGYDNFITQHNGTPSHGSFSGFRRRKHLPDVEDSYAYVLQTVADNQKEVVLQHGIGRRANNFSLTVKRNIA
jgi:hypothetical protein